MIPGSGISPGEGNGNPLQYSCLENPTDGGAWQATVHGVTESDTTEPLHFLSIACTVFLLCSFLMPGCTPSCFLNWLPLQFCQSLPWLSHKTGSTSAVKIEISFQYHRLYLQRQSNTQCKTISM